MGLIRASRKPQSGIPTFVLQDEICPKHMGENVERDRPAASRNARARGDNEEGKNE